MKKTILSFSFLLGSIIYADISGIGYAQTRDEAKKEALADLSQVIKSEVRTNYESTSYANGTDGGTSSKSNIKISSNLPILGADFSFIDLKIEVRADVKLSPKKVSTLYIYKLSMLNREINFLLDQVKKSKSNTLILNIYEEIFSLLKEYDRYESVAVILGARIPKSPNITKGQVKIELAKLDSEIESLEFAAAVLAKSFNQKKIFVYPPLMQNSTTATQFSSVFQKELKAKLSSVSSPKSASYILVGEYTLTDKSMILNYELLNTFSNEVITSKTINIKKKVYVNLKTKPKNIDFNALLNSGVISSSDLKVSLNSNRGNENLLFNNGEEIELFVKLNKMGYFYIVGYTQTVEAKLSYLLELSEGNGNSKFVKFINADDASRWISLGAFTIEPPYGVESIQVIASNQKITSLPSTNYDEKSGYYIISKDIKKALSQTRGLKKKVGKKIEMSEDVMSFTTMNK
ncbi:hypothetical protein SMGD1_0678 [Sulfurimonas gotlandica GD1]|uniref:Uncharacterized protein n=1 Tax=Sulfurimonas gotlandica (strain DSM 19862 / JCM 16533 / GD1) TaxID=929558 RepID=B6BKZ1_SULGG|nr:hypothetical protein [Sulfurimonas gotlandica]EDZ62392.1 hypothetical protein CBGD1_308 [Sulfurimonas gotlandica GD1]EHP29205.1 hypothetical protein SMGD1_0678 [Sulfurimonas gotlandica GD1]